MGHPPETKFRLLEEDQSDSEDQEVAVSGRAPLANFSARMAICVETPSRVNNNDVVGDSIPL